MDKDKILKKFIQYIEKFVASSFVEAFFEHLKKQTKRGIITIFMLAFIPPLGNIVLLNLVVTVVKFQHYMISNIAIANILIASCTYAMLKPKDYYIDQDNIFLSNNLSDNIEIKNKVAFRRILGAVILISLMPSFIILESILSQIYFDNNFLNLFMYVNIFLLVVLSVSSISVLVIMDTLNRLVSKHEAHIILKHIDYYELFNNFRGSKWQQQ